jgi:putative FmdB family regulatory protein
MPTYDYKCNACKKRMEIFQSIKDAPKRKCPECGKNSLERLIGTGGAIIFKGSGFYQTDYRSESYKKGAESDKPAESPSAESKAETKTDAKPAEAKTSATEGSAKAEPKATSESKSDKGEKASKSVNKTTAAAKSKSKA